MGAACTGGGTTGGGTGGGTGSDSPVGSASPPTRVVAPTAGDPGASQQPERVEVTDGAVNLRARPFDEAVVLDERHLAIRFFGGVAPCDVVGLVDVNEIDDEVFVTLVTGSAPDAGDLACIDIAVYKEVVVELESPLGGRRIVDTEA